MVHKLYNKDGLEMLSEIPDKSVDLVLTDPPYITSRSSGMQSLFSDPTKSSEKYGRMYAIKTDYGEWDRNFTLDELGKYVTEFYRVLKDGGTSIIFFDIWKITQLSDMYNENKFKQVRLIEWLKTNPVPINAKVNYLSNAREIAVSAIKKSKPTFNSYYDKGVYEYPIYSGKDRFHPTQKSLKLFEDLIMKHSNENDVVLDCFMGSGTTVIACANTTRKCIGSEINEEYYTKVLARVESNSLEKFFI